MAKSLKTRSSKHQILVKDLLYLYQGVSSKCCVQKGSEQNTDIVNRLTALNNLKRCMQGFLKLFASLLCERNVPLTISCCLCCGSLASCTCGSHRCDQYYCCCGRCWRCCCVLNDCKMHTHKRIFTDLLYEKMVRFRVMFILLR